MILQTANIISGFILSAPKIAEFGGKEKIESIRSKLLPYQKTIGLIELVLGVIGLVQRIGIGSLYVNNLGASYSQSIPAILVGLILAASAFERFPKISELIAKIRPFSVGIGLWAILSALISIFFGCVAFCAY